MRKAFCNKHYIIVREDSAIIAGWSDGPHPEKDISNAICINEQGSYQFRLFYGGEENPVLYNANRVPLYKWNGIEVVKRSEKEIVKDRSAIITSPSFTL